MKKKKLNTLNIFGGSKNSDVALSRNEMRKIMAGSGNGSTNCGCYNINGVRVGSVTCYGLDPQTCCAISYGEAFAANCS